MYLYNKLIILKDNKREKKGINGLEFESWA